MYADMMCGVLNERAVRKARWAGPEESAMSGAVRKPRVAQRGEEEPENKQQGVTSSR